MMKNENPHNYDAGFTVENHRDELIDRLGKAIGRINELEEEIGSFKEANRKRVAKFRAKKKHFKHLWSEFEKALQSEGKSNTDAS